MKRKKKKPAGTNGTHAPADAKGDYAHHMAEGGTERNRFTESLPIPIKDEHERLELGNALAAKCAELSVVEEARRADMSRHKESLIDIKEHIKELSEAVNGGTIKGQVQCARVLCRDSAVRVFRLDTGAELEVAQASDADLQETLDLTADPDDVDAECPADDGIVDHLRTTGFRVGEEA